MGARSVVSCITPYGVPCRHDGKREYACTSRAALSYIKVGVVCLHTYLGRVFLYTQRQDCTCMLMGGAEISLYM